jgi:hypothetical protein
MSPEFERAFVAMSYRLGRRGAELAAPLAAPSPDAGRLLAGLSHPERDARARLLAAELARVGAALAARSFR